VRMLQRRGELDLLQETLRPDDRRQLRMQHLDRDAPAMTKILGEIDRGHSAGTELAFESVAIDQRGYERGRGSCEVSAQRVLSVQGRGRGPHGEYANDLLPSHAGGGDFRSRFEICRKRANLATVSPARDLDACPQRPNG
jgi:hypothetical protein